MTPGLSSSNTPTYSLNHLRELESEAIYIIREAAASFEKLGLLFSGGKDSLVLLHLAKKAFYPAKPPLFLIHIDTGFNFPEVLETITNSSSFYGTRLLQIKLDDEISAGRLNINERDLNARFNAQGLVLTDLILRESFNAVLGGGRRDEDSARAKERFFSNRNEFGLWEPKNQRPEIWQLFNTRINSGEHQRVFPISNWTEADVWQYIEQEGIKLPSVYFSHQRNVVARDGTLLDLETGVINLKSNEEPRILNVRLRTVGDIPTSGFILSEAKTVRDIAIEVEVSRRSERASRTSDSASGKNLEDLKINGHF